MKEIQLTKGYVALVDDEDFEYLNQFRWHVEIRREHCIYAVRNTYFREGVEKRSSVKMHREIMKPDNGMTIDHIDHNGLNNQKSNLRICTNRDNAKNRLPSSNKKYKGVYRKISKYTGEIFIYANIKHGEKLIHIGKFYSDIDAAMAYDIKAIEFFGEFAYLNFPDKIEYYKSLLTR